ncbi:MAG: bifunctional phosphoribosyl-AMP cyclohydrolase/phosphoribosyl-ATP diphosphatase HisIE [Clostridiales bacterium]|jgi:phosphoribosyl-ATP pyrophosphohydrolase/phosphoribosyl-AMP cyclohydrolase|nr:bifunctional phosphoribosyl-AMP cyclohydrolase/phosphoribosyl-ATP diphosphatase HisIE [Clostridiales bacterium]
MDLKLENIKFDEKGLIPAIVQDVNTGKALMLAYMNEESIKLTLETRKTWFYSRSREKLWNKGETSGNYQMVKKLYYDCDGDTILLEVEPMGPSCHTGEESCFFNKVIDDNAGYDKDMLEKLYSRITDRRENPVDGSYTNYLFTKGVDKILKKVGEETSEVIIASKNNSKDEMTYEISDLVYHMLVLMVDRGVTISDIKKELGKRYK